MGYFIQQLINGVTLGSVYGLIAIGYTMVYGVVGMINFAHGEIFMVSAFVAFIAYVLFFSFLGTLFVYLGLPGFEWVGMPVALFLTLVISMLLIAVWGWTLERVAYRPLRTSFRLAPLITAIGASIVLQNFVQLTQGASSKSPRQIISGNFVLNFEDYSVIFQYKQIFVIVLTIILMGIFSYIIARTSLGRTQRACEQDRVMATLLGVNVDRVIALTFIMGAVLAAVAGMMHLILYPRIEFTTGFIAGMKAFTAAVLGGIGSIPGAMLGGLVIGLVETFFAGYFFHAFKDIAAFSVLILVLIFFPSGFLGKPEIEKV
jgi:branched-chain amino acid transport system permease protein